MIATPQHCTNFCEQHHLGACTIYLQNYRLQAPRIRFEDLEQRYLRNFRDDAPMHYISEIHISKVFTNHLY